MTEPDNTSSQTLVRAARIGKAAGLRFVYAGNMPGRTGELENTYCPNCHELLVERVGFHVVAYRLTSRGSCPSCGVAIPGRWAADFQGQIADFPYLPRLQKFDRMRTVRRP
jgi:pyruvate formate lyase activating enzyme